MGFKSFQGKLKEVERRLIDIGRINAVLRLLVIYAIIEQSPTLIQL